MKIKQDEMELKYKTNEESLKNQLIKAEKEIAVLKQNNEFLDIQVKDLNTQLDEQKRNHENIIATLESKTFSMVGHEEFQKKVDEIKAYFENEKKLQTESFEKSKQMYISQIDSLTEKLNEIDFKGKLNIEQLEIDLTEYTLKYEKSVKDIAALQTEKKNLAESLLKKNEEFSSTVKFLNEDFEKKNEEKEDRHHRELSDLNKNSEDTISQLKALFESEKIRFEERLKEEKSKNEKKIRFTIEEYEGKIKEIENDLREELDNLQNDYSDLECNHQNYISNAEHEIDLLNQKIEALEGYLRESREAFNNMQNQSSYNIDQINENFSKERKEFVYKLETLTTDNNNKEKELTSLHLKRDQLDKIISEKDAYTNQMKKEHEEEKKDILAKLDHFKEK